MQRENMNRLIEQHLAAEKAGNPAGCVAMYTDDVIHDVACSPAGPLEGPDATPPGLASTLTGPPGMHPRRIK